MFEWGVWLVLSFAFATKPLCTSIGRTRTMRIAIPIPPTSEPPSLGPHSARTTGCTRATSHTALATDRARDITHPHPPSSVFGAPGGLLAAVATRARSWSLNQQAGVMLAWTVSREVAWEQFARAGPARAEFPTAEFAMAQKQSEQRSL